MGDIERLIRLPKATEAEPAGRWRLAGCAGGLETDVIVVELGRQSVKVVTLFDTGRSCM